MGDIRNSLSLMDLSSMLFELLHSAVSISAGITGEPFIIKVQFLVGFQAVRVFAGKSADAAHEAPLVQVNLSMTSQVMSVLKFLVA